MFHVTDLFPTFARLANATAGVPTDRVIDGLDQTALLLGESVSVLSEVTYYSYIS